LGEDEMKKTSDGLASEQLDTIIHLLRYLVALELSKRGVPQSTIGKHLHVAKSAVVEMLRGVEKRGKANERTAT
jgi:predicted transcriptional regulator